MRFVAYCPSIAGLALAALTISSFGQSTPPSLKTLHSIIQDLDAHPEGPEPEGIGELEGLVDAATIAEIKQELPTLVSLTESPHPQQSVEALLILITVARRQKAGLPKNRAEIDPLAAEAIRPYISRLAPRFTDPSPNRGFALMLFTNLVGVRPVSPELVKVALRVLQDPKSTQTTPDTTSKSPGESEASMGPQILWLLLPADANFYRDPATNTTEGQDSPEVQQAIVNFLRRPDQTAESLSETVRALALSQVQNLTVNRELLHLLNSTDPIVQKAILSHIASLTLAPEDFASAHARVMQIAANPSTPVEIQKLAKPLLTCWSNDRHHDNCPG